MINKTRIFISSAYETDLKGPRKIIKEYLEQCGHEVPIFEDGDFGTWEKDTLKQCLEIVESSDVVILLINRKSGARSRLMNGNVTPTYLEYVAARQKNKHMLVFVSPNVKQKFNILKAEFDRLYEGYVAEFHRSPNSPYDPLMEWIEDQLESEGTFKQLLEEADPFVWAFLFEVFRDGNWIYDFDISKSSEQAHNISATLSTSLRSVVGLISEREHIDQLKNQATYLYAYAEYSLQLLNEMNSMKDIGKHTWSNFLDVGLSFLMQQMHIFQTPDVNPRIVNTVSGCNAASLYSVMEGNITMLTLVGAIGDINPDEFYQLDEENIYVVDSYNQQVRLITFNAEKQTIYVTEPIGNSVLCMHFDLTLPWSEEQVKAYESEINYAIIEQHEFFYEFLIRLLGGRT
ncbi:DUF4062 domain-containing protein [Sutcliffiella horikoshii]|uniref:DUF4062 domain-containing protein n=1 Tax=Sutcliffiella horikoshii TaxID=79883 RepID=UPI001CBBC153|nr:DUF4062 domain-containing protein [Sutcliffiella horikoshii]UAL48060.1 DUF4062 domain-containing protein [Sutcliffiella horikoshii]